MTTIYLIRHAEAEGNLYRIAQGQDNSNLTDAQLMEKFMLLSRANNLLKSRICEECKKTGKRGKEYKVIEFWYEGDENYSEEIGCKGCFWHDPTTWRSKLNDFVKEHGNG